ncbi:hypothetical protein L6272_01585 [Microgenomates group bacterium]|nr:hypothetical protein [Microgenomates group bacterium]
MSDCCQDKSKTNPSGKKLTFMEMVKNAFGLQSEPKKTEAKASKTQPAQSCCHEKN